MKLKLKLLALVYLALHGHLAFSASGMLRNPNLDSEQLDGWKIETDIMSCLKIEEEFDYGFREKNILGVSRGSKNDFSKIEIDSVADMIPGLPIYYFVKVGFSGSESAEFKVEILNERNRVISSQVYSFYDNQRFHDIYIVNPIPSPSIGKFKLRILMKNSEDLGICFIYFAQMGSSLEGIIVREPHKLYDELIDYKNIPNSGIWYRIRAKHSGQHLVNTPIAFNGAFPISNRTIRQLKNNEQNDCAKFKLLDAGEGAYYIESKSDGTVMDICGASSGCAEVIHHEKNGGDNQKWYLDGAGEGYYYIRSKLSGYVMDISEESDKQFAPVLVHPINCNNNQRFMFIEAD